MSEDPCRFLKELTGTWDHLSGFRESRAPGLRGRGSLTIHSGGRYPHFNFCFAHCCWDMSSGALSVCRRRSPGE